MSGVRDFAQADCPGPLKRRADELTITLAALGDL